MKGFLTEKEVTKIITETVSKYNLDNKKVIVLLPDSTRSGPTDFFFKQFCNILGNKVKKLDFLIPLGTHPIMNENKILKFLNITKKELKTKYSKFGIFNHRWDLPETFVTIGTISDNEICEITNGLFKEKVKIEINKLVFEYDYIIIYGPVFPHEVVGFSGGYKYLFPGIAGKEIIDFFHWLGAVITNIEINGKKDTPVRHVINKSASFLKIPIICFCSVVNNGKLIGLFTGDHNEAWQKAVELSSKVNIISKSKRYKKVLGIAPKMYDDLWTAGKVMYKLEQIVEDGGDLIIYAPHIKEVSYTHGKILDKIGYHTVDYFKKQIHKFKNISRCVMAHSSHVKGIGKYTNGIEKSRINVYLATDIPEQRCKKINLGYINPKNIDINEWLKYNEKDVLVVYNAGEVLYTYKK